jgi:hypothetical protein
MFYTFDGTNEAKEVKVSIRVYLLDDVTNILSANKLVGEKYPAIWDRGNGLVPPGMPFKV